MNRTPVAPVRLNPDVPAKLENIVQCAMEKDRELRYQHASDVRAELQRLKRDRESERSMMPNRTGRTVVGAPITHVQNVSSVPRGASESESSRTLEMAHVLFTDIVAYSRLPMDEQEQVLRELQDAVRATTEFAKARAEDQLVRLPNWRRYGAGIL